MARTAQNSIANLCVIPLQDVLGLGSEARMNTPSLSQGNWDWRYRKSALTPQLAEKLAVMAEVSDRLPSPLSAAAARGGSWRKLRGIAEFVARPEKFRR